jgi:hypothetical protein
MLALSLPMWFGAAEHGTTRSVLVETYLSRSAVSRDKGLLTNRLRDWWCEKRPQAKTSIWAVGPGCLCGFAAQKCSPGRYRPNRLGNRLGLGGLEPPTSPLSGGWGDRGLRNDSRIRWMNGEQNRRVLCTIVTRSDRLGANLKLYT